MATNILYLAVLPLIRVPSRHLGSLGVTSGFVQEYLTLQGDRSLATEFFPDEVNHYVQTFEASMRYLTGGHVIGYEVAPQDAGNGRVVVKVVQHVA